MHAKCMFCMHSGSKIKIQYTRNPKYWKKYLIYKPHATATHIAHSNQLTYEEQENTLTKHSTNTINRFRIKIKYGWLLNDFWYVPKRHPLNVENTKFEKKKNKPKWMSKRWSYFRLNCWHVVCQNDNVLSLFSLRF